MRNITVILSISLNLASIANANAVYECSLLDEGKPYAQMIKYENKFVEIFPTGEVEEFFCTSLPFNYTKRPVCISNKMDTTKMAIFTRLLHLNWKMIFRAH